MKYVLCVCRLFFFVFGALELLYTLLVDKMLTAETALVVSYQFQLVGGALSQFDALLSST